jgi:DNA-binding LacI/PurR family transcriptional regulator
MLLGAGRMNRQTDESLTRMFSEMRIDGLVLVGMMPISPSVADIASRVPTVVTGSRDVDLPHVDTIANDDLQGAEFATRHLIELGHIRIAHISGWGAVGRLRQQAYENTMREAGLQDHIRIEPSDMTEEGGYRAAVGEKRHSHVKRQTHWRPGVSRGAAMPARRANLNLTLGRP